MFMMFFLSFSSISLISFFAQFGRSPNCAKKEINEIDEKDIIVKFFFPFRAKHEMGRKT